MTDVIDFSAQLNGMLGGWNTGMGLRFLKATSDECIGELVVGPQHLQPYGIVHGGVHTGIIEAACSTGAAVSAGARGQSVVGLENSTSFITAVRGGTLRVTATPVTRGRRTQVWEAVVTNEDGRTCATGRVRLLCLEAGSELAGKSI
jgi:1,4-dihydroxy-2-naphthoyl-CoA hydrolase